ncbi:ZINC FINGER PROTEIN 598 domain containing protein, putative [Babesia bigemina]|uniref:ZINC FINGER PROTEIN 598 domain containing protein, putative n=1 Tax=Babesia bigemina TaxID=5866 RepID=A0A061D9I5_BABBI|nr:ZINC FINGER PROTEIN 598 domain containing protein, putative [Babesia bigemina]CDR94380.1 ZINC FINGER PROTEIN 598 domain containing protein, putative [Babesia bigemina]|eukprot:XP_012766566.1 ZINC FINGER PROTEIN 598 domain containing protein, putative [Babesia bigemina]
MGSRRQLGPEGGPVNNNGPRGRARWPANLGSPYTLFRDNLHDSILDVYMQSGVARSQSLTREHLAAVAQQPVSEHFHSYMCCSICYENALICAVGKCTHLMCFLCMMRLKNFYDSDSNVHQCPYCKQESDVLVICANPFFAHFAVQKSLYSQEGARELTRSSVESLLRVVSGDTPLDRRMLSRDAVNIKDLFGVFLRTVDVKRDTILKAPGSKMQHLVRKAQQLSIKEREERDPFKDVYNLKQSKPRFYGDHVAAGDGKLVFEHPNIYMLFRAVSSALCWVPECKAHWHTSMPLDAPELLVKAIEKLYQNRHTSFESLNKHLKSKHGLVCCDICQGHFGLKHFICEMPLYRYEDIKAHVRFGDTDRVPPIPAHVMCSACRRMQWDNTELKRHAKSDHFYCNLCDSEGFVCEIFSDYGTLFSHFKTYHYPCEEPDCMFMVFPDDLQLQLHYMSKHPTVHRSQSSRQRKAQPPVQQAAVPVTKITASVCALPTSSLPWDGNIRIVPDAEPVVPEPTPEPEPQAEPKVVSAEFEEWLRKREYLTDPQLRTADKSTELLNAFAQTLINLKLGSTVRQFDFDTFSVNCATRVQCDLERVSALVKSSSFPPRCELWERLPSDFRSHVEEALSDFRVQYGRFVEESISGKSQESGAPNLLDLVKSSMCYLMVFVYSINFHVEYEKLLRVVKASSVEHKVSPNGLMLLNVVEDMVPIASKILVKQAFDWVVNALEGAVNNVSAMKQQPVSLSAVVKKKTKSGSEFSLEVLNPGRDLSKEIGQHKLQKRQEQLLKRMGRKPNAWGKVQEAPDKRAAAPEPEPEPAAPAPESAPEPESSKADKLQEPAVDNERYAISVEDSFKQSLNSDFYAAMVDVIRNALAVNDSKFNATSVEHRLRDTTCIKINQLLMSGTRRFTTLSEFVPMQLLESLQALEPEFYRLVKEARMVNDVEGAAKKWSYRCANALRRCRVEHLEVLDYYLTANAAAMALRSDAEFPSLGDGGSAKSTVTRRNYAQALNVRSSKNFVLLDSEFPALG